MATLSWFKIKDGDKITGVVGAFGNQIVVLASFYDVDDINKDGNTSFGETFASFWISSVKKRNLFYNLAAVAMNDENIVLQTNIGEVYRANQLGLFVEGLVSAVVDRYGPAEAIAGFIANRFIRSKIKAFIVKKGMEQVVNDALTNAILN